ncbi:hypothetical protein D3C71_1595690 [compost metagenome]
MPSNSATLMPAFCSVSRTEVAMPWPYDCLSCTTATFLGLALSMMNFAAEGPCWSSRPMVRKMYWKFLPSVSAGEVAEGVTTTTPSLL